MSFIADEMKKFSESTIKDVKREWNKFNDDNIVRGNANIKFEITEDTEGHTVGEYTATGQKMWILEYGKGKLADTDSPTFRYYKTQKMFNRNRKKMEVRTREDVYEDLDGNEHIGSYIPNLNTDAFIYNEHGKYKKKLQQEPLHILKENIHRKGSAREEEFKLGILDAVKKNIENIISLSIKRG